MAISAKITELATQLAGEEEKIAKGNFSAGTRARKLLMEITKVCKAGRGEIQQTRIKAA